MSFSKRFIKHQYFIPGDHGSWVFVLSPLIIGLIGGKNLSFASFILIIAVFAAFLSRQPAAIAVKAISGRRPRTDLAPALFWLVIYGLIGSLAAFGLIINGYSYLLYLAVPGIIVFVWHLFLVSKRAERRQLGIELVASGVLALSAPAAYWVGVNAPNPVGWWLFLLNWFQSAASIVYAYLRLEQRILPKAPDIPNRLKMGYRALAYTGFNFFVVMVLGINKILPQLLFIPYGIQFIETIWGTLIPAIGYKPTKIGVRQLIISTLFTIFFIFTWTT